MRFVLLSVLLITSLTAVAADGPALKRHHLGEWEKDIGYSGVVEVNNQLFISGIACAGKTMEEAIKHCYTTVHEILKKYNATSDQIIKETVYTTDIEALIKAIPTRKSFFNSDKYPAATWVQISRLYSPGDLLEVELIVQRK